MKIIHCLNFFLPEQIGGTEIYTNALSKELLEKGIEAIVLIPNYGKDITETYFHNKIRVIRFAEPSVLNRELISGKAIPAGVPYFKKVIEEEKPDIVHFHIVGGSNGITLHHVQAAKGLGRKIVMTFHIAGYSCKTGTLFYKNESACDGIIDASKCTRCIYVDKKIAPIKRSILYAAAVTSHGLHFDTTRFNNTIGTAIGMPFLVDKLKDDLMLLSKTCDKMIVLTHWYKKILEANEVPSYKLIHIAQGLPDQKIFEKREIETAVLKLVFIGRIIESKGLHLVIDALKQLPSQKISLDIFGQISEDGYAIKLKEATANMENVSWKGILSPDNIVETLSAYDCLCIPSVISEMSPLVIQEAFAAGIPVVASAIYGNAEQVRDGENGWLFNFNDSDDLKIKLQLLIDMPEKIMVAKKNIPLVRSFKNVADDHEVLYNELLQNT